MFFDAEGAKKNFDPLCARYNGIFFSMRGGSSIAGFWSGGGGVGCKVSYGRPSHASLLHSNLFLKYSNY